MRSLLFVGLAMLGACAANASPQAAPAVADAPAVVAPVEPASPVWAEAPVAETTARLERADLECDIVRTRTSRGVELRAIASSDARVAGEYEFTITKRDRSGSSDIMQSGEFALDGDTASLGSAEVSVSRGGGYDARLELTSLDGEICVAEASR
ncbi:MAG: curli-like amyloid fiber formation chaperone CsgH [Hyphomonadaceae bacterium]